MPWSSQTVEPSALVTTIGFSAPCADQEWKTWARSSSKVRLSSIMGAPAAVRGWWAAVSRCGEAEVDALRAPGRRVAPARGDHLATGEEVHALGAVGVGVAEQRALPAAEGEVRHRHRDRHVDPDHADLDLVLEQPGRGAVAGEDRGAVAVLVGVDQVETLAVAADADDREHRAEDLLGVDAHVRRDVVEQGGAHPVAGLLAAHLRGATVDDDLRAGLLALADEVEDPVGVLTGDQRTHVGLATVRGGALGAVADADAAGAVGDPGDEVVAHGVDGHDHADGHAALAGRAVAGRDGGVGHGVEVGVRAGRACGSWRRRAPARACRRPCRSRRRTPRRASTRRS